MPKDEGFVIDMTDAVVLGALPVDRPYLVTVSAWKPGQSSAGNRKVHIELTVKKPDDLANRKIFEDISLENEFTKGRLQSLLLALGLDEKEVKSKAFRLPKAENMLSLECTVILSATDSDQYGPGNRVRRARPASVYAELAGAS